MGPVAAQTTRIRQARVNAQTLPTQRVTHWVKRSGQVTYEFGREQGGFVDMERLVSFVCRHDDTKEANGMPASGAGHDGPGDFRTQPGAEVAEALAVMALVAVAAQQRAQGGDDLTARR